MKFQNMCFKYTPRMVNLVAHKIATNSLKKGEEEDGEIGENRDGKDRFLLGTATGRMTEMKDQESTVWAVQIRLD
ncbi:hypothetical protein PVK06_035510 [Gossypium arboreum]|uniref:Uncharacterized protein n=1 Tax=Gossypium arboreum TaxID=29729 RepID=A0ABR0NGZ7_GOSAR|nr:hypothetical protein PVK06_035510 [Gossypium arboreum]